MVGHNVPMFCFYSQLAVSGTIEGQGRDVSFVSG